MRKVLHFVLGLWIVVLLTACEIPLGTSSDKEILSFAFLTVDNPVLDEPAQGLIDQDSSTIYFLSFYPLPLNDYPLVVRFTISGAKVRWNTIPVISGITPLRYLPWPDITVVAEDRTTRNYNVEVRQPPLDALVTNFNQANRMWVNNGSGMFTGNGQALSSSGSSGVALRNVHW
jgi:hypothetical protein